MRSLHRPNRPRAATGAVLVLAVLLAHGLLWTALLPAPNAPTPHPLPRPTLPHAQATQRPAATTMLQLLQPPRSVVAVAAQGAPGAVSQVPPAQPTPTATPQPAPPPAAVPRGVPRGVSRGVSQVAARSVALAPAAAAPAAATQALELVAPPPAAPTHGAGPAELPVYATRLPDPARLHYRLQRGADLGSATLLWQRSEVGYVLRLDLQWPGQPAQGSASRGQIDVDGVAPLRHAELRRAREQRAVNFQRDVATITFSGPQTAYALPPGAQDRLSWMIQLPAVVEADAALARAGAVVTLFVAGTRGDAQAWRFEVLGREALQLPSGAVAQALALRREPTRPYDTRVEVWLDPARQHLPVRAVFTTLPGGQPLQLELASLDSGLENDPVAPR